MEYKIIEHTDPSTLAKLINTEMGNGWRVQGGVTISKYGDYIQALIKGVY
ncbi:DUF1737 domain-containing protein [Winogradskyella thalassocola]|uniref:Uncharacterized protein n=1 Tax=Winogradskyella thalassocola TaxID=262004 RepID=A0A1G8B8J5_9FLAO|nr:DUF1737 domain-containing protein [Winogradskyella thalassocola]SDH29559.1 protein of unknown function [Winogradskyella thalassocola]